MSGVVLFAEDPDFGRRGRSVLEAFAAGVRKEPAPKSENFVLCGACSRY